MDEFFDGLENVLRARARARSSDVVRFDGATATQVDIVVELQAVARVISEHCRSVLMDGDGKWLEVADMLEAATKVCRNEAEIESIE